MNLTIFLNGRYIRVTEKAFENLLPGSLEGKGAFETMRMYEGRIFAFDDHTKRLLRGLDHFRMKSPMRIERMKRIVSRLSTLNHLKNSRVRIIIWKNGKKKNISLSCQPLRLPSRKVYIDGFSVTTARHRKPGGLHSQVKSIDYKMFRSAFKEARLKGFDEALLINRRGEIVEGTRTNIFFSKRGVLYTPALSTGCLNGITRQKIIACARRLRIRVVAFRTKLPSLLRADEAFLSGSTLEVMPIKSVNGKRIGGRKRPLTRQLQKAYQKMVKESLNSQK